MIESLEEIKSHWEDFVKEIQKQMQEKENLVSGSKSVNTKNEVQSEDLA